MEAMAKIGKFTIKFENFSDEKELFELASGFEEIFGRNNKCKCDSNDVSLNVRIATDTVKNKKYKYYEKICNDCGLRFPYGQTDNNKLFPKYNPGWHKYVPPKDDGDDKKGKK